VHLEEVKVSLRWRWADYESRFLMFAERGWTWSHGFFVIMGGFVLHDSGGKRPLYPLDLENIDKLVQRGAIDFPDITDKEIQDRSKGDVISKGFAVIQTGWFITQCVARGVEHLAITELEITTLAFAFLNLVTYMFWWNKPLKVTRPVRIVLKEGHSVPEPEPHAMVPIEDRVERRVERIFTLITPNRDDDVDLVKRVPIFYAGNIEKGSKSWGALWIAEMVIAMVFGGIHCIAWSFSFPTHIEQVLWRALSITIMSIPFLMLLLLFVLFPLDLHISAVFAGLFVCFMSLIYAFARLALLILSFISLRSLPPSAFDTVYWTTLIPHIG
jgi:hypothetical protein